MKVLSSIKHAALRTAEGKPLSELYLEFANPHAPRHITSCEFIADEAALLSLKAEITVTLEQLRAMPQLENGVVFEVEL